MTSSTHTLSVFGQDGPAFGTQDLLAASTHLIWTGVRLVQQIQITQGLVEALMTKAISSFARNGSVCLPKLALHQEFAESG